MRPMIESELTQVFMEKLLPDIIHKIKNNLGGIGGFAALLEKESNSGHPNSNILWRIEEGVQKINRIIGDLTAFIKKSETKREPVKLKEMIEEVIRLHIENGRLDALCEVESSDERTVLTQDRQSLAEMIDYCLRYMTASGGKIHHISITRGPAHSTLLDFEFGDGEWNGFHSDTVIDYLRQSDPIESRLSLAVALRYAEALGCTVSIAQVQQNRKKMNIHL